MPYYSDPFADLAAYNASAPIAPRNRFARPAPNSYAAMAPQGQPGGYGAMKPSAGPVIYDPVRPAYPGKPAMGPQINPARPQARPRPVVDRFYDPGM